MDTKPRSTLARKHFPWNSLFLPQHQAQALFFRYHRPIRAFHLPESLLLCLTIREISCILRVSDMACHRQPFTCHTYEFFGRCLSTPSYNRAAAARSASSFSQLRSLWRSSHRHTHTSQSCASGIGALNRSKHHSAIASSQAARKESLQKLKQREDTMGMYPFFSGGVSLCSEVDTMSSCEGVASSSASATPSVAAYHL